MKLGEVIEFTRRVGPARAFPIHDINLSAHGLASFDDWLTETAGTHYARVPLGGPVDLA